MYAITGITGKVGGIVARRLLAAGCPVRAIVRNADKGREKGCEVAISYHPRCSTLLSGLLWEGM